MMVLKALEIKEIRLFVDYGRVGTVCTDISRQRNTAGMTYKPCTARLPVVSCGFLPLQQERRSGLTLLETFLWRPTLRGPPNGSQTLIRPDSAFARPHARPRPPLVTLLGQHHCVPFGRRKAPEHKRVRNALRPYFRLIKRCNTASWLVRP